MQTCNFGDTYSQGSLFFILTWHFLSSPRKTEKPITGLFLLFNHTKSNCRHASETSTHCHCWIPQFKLLKICQSWPPSPGQRNPPSGTAQNFVILEYLVDPWQSRQSSHKNFDPQAVTATESLHAKLLKSLLSRSSCGSSTASSKQSQPNPRHYTRVIWNFQTRKWNSIRFSTPCQWIPSVQMHKNFTFYWLSCRSQTILSEQSLPNFLQDSP